MLELLGFEEIVEVFLEGVEKYLGSEGYMGFMVDTDGLKDGFLSFGCDFSSNDTFKEDYCIYTYNLEDEDFDEDYIKLQIKKGLEYFIDGLFQ